MIQKPVRNHAMIGNHQHYARMTHPHPHRYVVPTTVLTRSRLVPLTAARLVTTAVPQTKVQHQRTTKHGVNAIQGVKGNWNSDADATFEVKEPEFEVHVSSSSSDKTKKHDDKTTREAKGKSLIELSTGVRYLSEEFEDFSSNNTNGVNAASTPVTTVGLNSTNSTNTSSVVGPSINVVSSNFELGGKSSYMDPSQYPDDPDMPALEDITYSDDEEDVGAQTDFSNLETNINVSPIPTTRVHKDHPVTQIISDLTSAP
nr:hypothetical protein [Tanacetum cinerariifolium]